MTDDSAAGWDTCDLCGGSLDRYDSARYLEIETDSCSQRVDAGFCSWDHLAAWVGRGEPHYEAWPVYVPPSGWKRNKERVADAGAVLLIVIWSALAAYGLHALAFP